MTDGRRAPSHTYRSLVAQRSRTFRRSGSGRRASNGGHRAVLPFGHGDHGYGHGHLSPHLVHHARLVQPVHLHIHTRVRHPTPRRHTSLIRPFIRASTPRTPPSSPLVPLFNTSRPYTPVHHDRPARWRERSPSPAKHGRRSLSTKVRSLLVSLVRRRDEARDEAAGSLVPPTVYEHGAPLRPHRSPGAASFHATSGRLTLEPTRSRSPELRTRSRSPAPDSPPNPYLLSRPRTRRLPDRLTSRFSDTSESDAESVGETPGPYRFLLGRKWGSDPTLVRPGLRQRRRSLDL